MSDKIYLGTHKTFGNTHLTKHSWDCGWYWGFGYLGNRNCHWHISSIIDHPKEYSPDWCSIDHHFSKTWLSQQQWWILRDLFISAYALQKAAEVYRYGGHQTESAKEFRPNNSEVAAKLNSDLGILLDKIWNLLHKWKEEK